MYSIYHFLKHLVANKSTLQTVEKLGKFPFATEMLSCQNDGVFPDLALRINSDRTLFAGGELIELKDSVSYSVSSFNSTIPTGTKEICKVIKGENSIIKRQMEAADDDIDSLPVRDVFYLVRGKRRGNTKVALVAERTKRLSPRKKVELSTVKLSWKWGNASIVLQFV
jgi:hypothetical protein